MIAKLDEETLRQLRRQDLDSLKFGGTAVPLSQIPASLDKAIKWMNKGRDWQPDPDNYGKLVNQNPVLQKAWSEFDESSREWMGENVLKPVLEGRRKLDDWTFSGIDALKEYDAPGKVQDAFTDMGRMITGKFDHLGPAKAERDIVKQTISDSYPRSQDMLNTEESIRALQASGSLTEAESSRFDKNLSTPNSPKEFSPYIYTGKSSDTFGGELGLLDKIDSAIKNNNNEQVQSLIKSGELKSDGTTTVFTKVPKGLSRFGKEGEAVGVLSRNDRKLFDTAFNAKQGLNTQTTALQSGAINQVTKQVTNQTDTIGDVFGKGVTQGLPSLERVYDKIGEDALGADKLKGIFGAGAEQAADVANKGKDLSFDPLGITQFNTATGKVGFGDPATIALKLALAFGQYKQQAAAAEGTQAQSTRIPGVGGNMKNLYDYFAGTVA